MTVYLWGQRCLRNQLQAAFTHAARAHTVGRKISPGGIRIADRVREVREERPKWYRSVAVTTHYCGLKTLAIHTGVNHEEVVRTRLLLLVLARKALRSPHRTVLKYRATVSTD